MSMDFNYPFFNEFVSIIIAGGLLMFPITILAIAIYWTAFGMFGYFSMHRFYRTRREHLEDWVNHPERAEGELGDIISYTQEANIATTDDVRNRFSEIRTAYLSAIDSKRGFLLTLVTSAPLMGLLGTVMGMLTTFAGLAVSSGSKTVDQIAAGISEALITTQTGLIIAIPAYVMATLIQKRRNQLDSCLTALETFTVQRFQKQLSKSSEL